MIVHAIRCNKCHDIIYSRTRHDFHYCFCGAVAIDGGFDYVSVIGYWKDYTDVPVLEINVTKQQLYNDWNLQKDKYGWIDYKTQKQLHLPKIGMQIITQQFKRKKLVIECICGKKFKCGIDDNFITCPKCGKIDNLNLMRGGSSL